MRGGEGRGERGKMGKKSFFGFFSQKRGDQTPVDASWKTWALISFPSPICRLGISEMFCCFLMPQREEGRPAEEAVCERASKQFVKQNYKHKIATTIYKIYTWNMHRCIFQVLTTLQLFAAASCVMAGVHGGGGGS